MTKPILGITAHRMPASVPRYAVIETYIEAVTEVGGVPIVLPLGLDPDTLRAAYGLIDGLLLPGGDDVSPDRYRAEPHPLLGTTDALRDELEIMLCGWALDDDLPILGICRGVQLLAVAAGGTLYQDVPTERSDQLGHDVREHGWDFLTHRVTIEANSRLARSVGRVDTRVNSFHHQAVRDVPPGFTVTAAAEDGVIEAIEAPDKRFVVGVQCHPEWMWRTTAPEFRGLFAAFADAAQEFARSRERKTIEREAVRR